MGGVVRNIIRRAVVGAYAGVAVCAALAAAPPTADAAPTSSSSPEIASPGAPSPWEDTSPYYEVTPAGQVWPLGGAPALGDLTGVHLSAPVIGVTMTPDAGGYWMVAADGGIFGFGDAHFAGSTGSMHLNAPIVGMAATPDGGGYWLFAGDGGIFSFGDAHFYGSTGSLHLAQPVVSMTPTQSGHGYWMVGADGGVFSYGDAAFAGSVVGTLTGQGVQRVVAAPDGGYWEVTHDGDWHPFGVASSDSPPVIAFVHTDAGPGDRAVDWAMAQQGKPYVWGGVGPNGFDCSGLVQQAWAAQGVGIPRVAADQYAAGAKVPFDQLLPGDLVYWATDPSTPSTIEHVAMYIGGGHMVNAPHTGDVVRTDWIGGGGFVGAATRP